MKHRLYSSSCRRNPQSFILTQLAQIAGVIDSSAHFNRRTKTSLTALPTSPQESRKTSLIPHSHRHLANGPEINIKQTTTPIIGPIWLAHSTVEERRQKEPEPDYGEKLFLTPFIKNGSIKKAQQLAKVGNLNNPVCDRRINEFGYSGYLTVNEKYNSNLFFWFFPAKENPENAPVLLWINGGPGASSMFGLFSAHGPFFVDTIGELQPRKLTWTQNHSILYVDSPVGTGFSFTDNEDGYCRTLNEVMTDLYEGLCQFFTLFPEYQPREFYITGQSYTGKYAPALAHKIHTENIKVASGQGHKTQPLLNLKGFAVGSGMCDPLTQCDYGEYLFNIGLIDSDEKSYFDNAYKQVCDLIGQEKWAEAHEILQHLIIGWPRPIVAHFEKLTGYTFHSNYLYQDMPARYGYYIQFLRNDFVRRGIHVGDQEFGSMKNKVYTYLANDFPQSVKPLVEELLDLKYKVLFYASQFDIIVPHTGIDRFIRSLNWHGQGKYRKTCRKVWLIDEEVKGYVKEVDNLIHVFCRNAGHLAPHDQPEACFDMITKFTRDVRF